MQTLTDPVVMHVIYALEHGGTERFLCRLLNRFAGDPVRHVLCTLRSAGARTTDLDPRVQVVPLNLAPRDRWGFVKLARAIRSTGASLVHARNINTWTDALLACRLARNAMPLLGFHGTQSPAGITATQRRRFRLLGAGNADIASVSFAGRQLLIDRLGCTPQRVHVLPNGVDLARFQPADANVRRTARERLQLRDGDFAIGNVGNMFSAVKGHAILLDAFTRIANAWPTARLLLAGFGPMQVQLGKQAERLGIAHRVQFLGATENVESLYAALDLYVCPSLSEGMSNALLEALACGIPSVATNIADHGRIFGAMNAASGLVPPGDVPALADALSRMLADAPERARLGVDSRRLVETDYNITDAFARYQRLYQTLLPANANTATEIEQPACTT
ncbi:MAG: glycosyltransferase [Phycisphaerales bacterium]|nr:glycosyltransferase [Phycisphaerales bacterium]